MSAHTAQFSIGQVIHHSRFGYRGVIVDVDATFQHSEEWYDSMARSRPPKDQPWYHVLVHDSDHMTYVAERNLEGLRATRSDFGIRSSAITSMSFVTGAMPGAVRSLDT